MPALLLSLLIAATPLPDDATTLRNVTIREWGIMPSFGSGVLMTVRKLVITTANGETRTLYRIHFDKSDETPSPGSRCDVTYSHKRNMNGHVGEGGVIQEGDVVTALNCHMP
jgi:hypothetical protein